jgi:transketolase
MASGSEVYTVLKAACELEKQGIYANVVSVPCFDLFVEQSKEYIKSVIKAETKVLAVEAGAGVEWYRFADDVVGMNRFGASGPANKLFEKFGFTSENVVKRACKLLGVEPQACSNCKA